MNSKRVSSPGPTDYNTDPVKFLKTNPRVTIGDAKLESSINTSKPKSPGPSAYRPNKLCFAKRAASVKFNREKRAGLVKDNKDSTPGPGDYMIPCKFLVRPRFMESKENKFRYV